MTRACPHAPVSRAAGRIGLLVAASLLAGCESLLPDTDRDPVRTAAGLESARTVGLGNLPADPELARAEARARAVRGFIRRGTPQRPALSDRPETDLQAGGGEITLDFVGADLASVVEVMLEDGLGANYVIDPGVGGTVTLRTNRPLRRAEILPTLEEILRLNNAAIVERAGVFRIVPRAQAGLSAPLVTAADLSSRGLTVRVTPLRFVAVDDIAEVLEGFAPVAGSIRFDPGRNLVFTTGTQAEQTTLQDIIATLDVNFFAGRSFALRPLREARAEFVVEELQALFASPAGGRNRAIRFLGVERINAVLVIAEDQVLLEEAMALIRHLDQGVGETPQLRVYPVRNRRAGEIAIILGDIFGVEVGGTGLEGSDIAPSLSERRDRTIQTRDARGVIVDPDAETETPEPGSTSPGGGPAPAPPAEGSRPGTLGGRSGVLQIVADEASNSLVALATADGAGAIENALQSLDRQPLQVMIEATLVEVQLNDTLEYGVRWFLQSGNFNFSFGDVVNSTIQSGAGNLFPGFNAAFRTTDIQVTLSALDAVTDVQVLSSPTLMVLDNQIARLQVGDQVPITTRSSQSTDAADAPIVAETEFRDTGVILEIRPTVNSGGLVVLEIRQEVSDVIDTAGDTNPTFAQRVVESTIAVQSGDTIALAGLIEETASRGREGIPVLSRIPVIGGAFGTTAESADRTELLVLIRPIVVRDQTDARAATEELRRKLVSLVPREETPGLLDGALSGNGPPADAE
ncbi:MAG: type II secretion system secretin GspD [Paracoccaceae bacterium]